MRRSFLTVALLACTAAVQPAWSADLASAVCPAPQPASTMTPSLTSNFYQNGLDQHQWRPFNGQHGTVATELEAYVPNEVRLVPGTALRLQTDKQTTLGHPYASGEITSQGLFAQTYGHFEMMAKMPEANGIWPAFWLLPENNTWPPEIDVMEYIYAPWGQHPAANAKASNNWMTSTAETTLHSGANNSAMAPGINSTIAPLPVYQDWNTKAPPAGWGSAYTGYHVYAIDWRPNSLVFLIDNAPVFCVTDAANATVKRVPSQPMFMLLNDAVTSGTQQSPGWPGFVEANQQFPVAMDIAYVHVSQFNDLATQVASAALPLDISGVTMMNGTGAITATAGSTLGMRMTVDGGCRHRPQHPDDGRAEKHGYDCLLRDILYDPRASQFHLTGAGRPPVLYVQLYLQDPGQSGAGRLQPRLDRQLWHRSGQWRRRRTLCRQ